MTDFELECFIEREGKRVAERETQWQEAVTRYNERVKLQDKRDAIIVIAIVIAVIALDFFCVYKL